MTTTELHKITCICHFKLEITIYREHGNVEDEEFYCPNCAYPYMFRASTPIQSKDIKIVEAGIIKEPHDLDPRVIYSILKEKKAKGLFHANTALTSLTFFEAGRLLSRQQVAEMELKQTRQYTDNKDKKFQIFNDIFMDVVDIHVQAGDYNKYGPVLFEFPLNLLNKYPFVFVRITRCNPSDWTEKMSLDQKYYISEAEFAKKYVLGNFSSMLIFPYIDGQFPLEGNLTRIKVDAPELVWADTKEQLHKEAIKYFKKACKEGLLKVKVNFRTCDKLSCNCHNSYEKQYGPEAQRLFSITNAF